MNIFQQIQESQVELTQRINAFQIDFEAIFLNNVILNMQKFDLVEFPIEVPLIYLEFAQVHFQSLELQQALERLHSAMYYSMYIAHAYPNQLCSIEGIFQSIRGLVIEIANALVLQQWKSFNSSLAQQLYLRIEYLIQPFQEADSNHPDYQIAFHEFYLIGAFLFQDRERLEYSDNLNFAYFQNLDLASIRGQLGQNPLLAIKVQRILSDRILLKKQLYLLSNEQSHLEEATEICKQGIVLFSRDPHFYDLYCKQKKMSFFFFNNFSGSFTLAATIIKDDKLKVGAILKSISLFPQVIKDPSEN